MSEEDVRVAYNTKTMMCVRLVFDGEEKVIVIGKTQDSKEVVIVGSFIEKNGEQIFYPTGVGWQMSDVEELIEAFKHFESGV